MTGGYSKYHYEKKPILQFYERGPGPAGYSLPPLVGKRGHGVTHRINPEYSFGLKTSLINKEASPGSAAYLIPQHLKANGYFAGYKYTCRLKTPIIDKRVTPAPNVYSLPSTDKYRFRFPTHYLGSRTPLFNKRIGPGPCAYMLPPALGPRIPNKLAAAECTLKGTRKDRNPPQSPSFYDIGPPELVKKKSPAFTMRPKWKDIQNGYEAGPASYLPSFPPPCPCKTPKKGAPLGIRYNDYTGIFRVPCDISKFDPLD